MSRKITVAEITAAITAHRERLTITQEELATITHDAAMGSKKALETFDSLSTTEAGILRLITAAEGTLPAAKAEELKASLIKERAERIKSIQSDQSKLAEDAATLAAQIHKQAVKAAGDLNKALQAMRGAKMIAVLKDIDVSELSKDITRHSATMAYNAKKDPETLEQERSQPAWRTAKRAYKYASGDHSTSRPHERWAVVGTPISLNPLDVLDATFFESDDDRSRAYYSHLILGWPLGPVLDEESKTTQGIAA